MSLDPQLREMGMERFLSGKGIFDTHSHKPRPRYQELSHAQHRGILLWAIHFAQEQGRQLRLYAEEKRLLKKIFGSNGTKPH